MNSERIVKPCEKQPDQGQIKLKQLLEDIRY